MNHKARFTIEAKGHKGQISGSGRLENQEDQGMSLHTRNFKSKGSEQETSI
jgi:hypothetical protein